jgi:hypothetical protein
MNTIFAKIISLKNWIFSRYQIWLKQLKLTEIIVIGDSHASVFKQDIFKSSFPKYFFYIVSIGGATVSGLTNPNSKTQALPIFRSKIESSKAKVAIVLLGEVDTGFVIWYRAEKYQTSVEPMLKMAVENYQNLLLEISKKASIICISTPLPTIEDDNDWGDIANARKEVKATQLQRTDLTLEFNQLMQTFCEENDLTYISLDRDSLGENGLVDSSLLNENCNDHHYNEKKYADLIIERLKPLL